MAQPVLPTCRSRRAEMGAFSCLCLPLPKRTSDGGSELELRSACEKITGPIAAKEPDRCYQPRPAQNLE